jgi:hypothetical protein
MFILLAAFFSCATALGYLTESRPHAQVVALNDAKSGVRVILVGCMHYNPSSIELASSIVHGLGASWGALPSYADIPRMSTRLIQRYILLSAFE